MLRLSWYSILMTITPLLFTGIAHAVPWELGIRGLGSGMQIEIRNTNTGALIGTYPSHFPDGAGVNFTIDFNGQAGADVQLTPEVQYTFIFKNWSNKAAYVKGHMPPGVTNYDDIYDIGINPDRLNLDETFGDGVQDMWGFPTAIYTPVRTCPTGIPSCCSPDWVNSHILRDLAPPFAFFLPGSLSETDNHASTRPRVLLT